MKVDKEKINNLYKSNNGFFSIKSKNTGPTITIMAGVHGDETSGLIATLKFLKMLEKGKIKINKGKINLVFANIPAIMQGVRQTDANLNRVFRKKNKLNKNEYTSYEYKRAKEIMPILKSTDALLDLHSSATPKSPPFVICEPNSYFIAKKMPTKIISRGWFDIEPGSTDDYVNKNKRCNNISICIECGYHDNPNGPKLAFEAIMIFLNEFDSIIPQKKYIDNKAKQSYIWANYIYKTKNNFCLANKFNDFQKLKKGTLIGLDGKEKVFTKKDSIIIFARNRKKANEEAFILAKEE